MLYIFRLGYIETIFLRLYILLYVYTKNGLHALSIKYK
jgi:hypothetical protein